MSAGVRRDVQCDTVREEFRMRYDVVKIKKGKITKVIGSSIDMQLAVRRSFMHMLYVIRYITLLGWAVSCSVTHIFSIKPDLVFVLNNRMRQKNDACIDRHGTVFAVRAYKVNWNGEHIKWAIHWTNRMSCGNIYTNDWHRTWAWKQCCRKHASANFQGELRQSLYSDV